MHWALMTAWVVAGVLTWTFFEYAFHRWLFHGTYMEQLHAIHHRASRRKYVIPFRLVFPVAAVVGSPIWFIGWQPEAFWGLGVLIGWRWYEYVHARLHTHVDEPAEAWNARYFGRLWLRHQSHHRFDWPGNFGVTNALWDRLFRTEEQVTYLPIAPVTQQTYPMADRPLPPLPPEVAEIVHNDLAKAMRKALER